jgi:hypothetical protein
MILTKEGYATSIGLLLPDNSTQQISPEDLRTSLINITDSVNAFLVDETVVAKNVASVSARTTLVGDGAIAKRDLAGRVNEDNSAFGYHALYGNYKGSKNTAIGATALSCNLYGDQNVAVGFNTIAGNTIGSGNVGIGNFALQTNKRGNFNIAIGHGAGAYVGENSNYNFYVGAHPVNYDDLCDIEAASGNKPLLFGDLLNRKLSVGGANTLHDFGTIQSSGDISPCNNDVFNLGHGSYSWDTAFLSNLSYPSSSSLLVTRYGPKTPEGAYPDQYTHSTVLAMDSDGNIGINTATPSGDHGKMTVAGHLVPSESGQYALGHPSLTWDGWFNNVVISGTLKTNIAEYTTVSECLYDCKTLHLATSGVCEDEDGFHNSTVCGYLSDSLLDGAGIEAHSSGIDYVRDYRYLFRAPDQSLTCLEVDSNYSRSKWQSNISIEVEDGLHMKTQRVLSDDRLSLVTQSGCHGLFFRALNNTSGNMTYLGSEDHIDLHPYKQSVNFIGASGNGDYYLSVGTVDSGVSVGIDLATRISDGMVGFGLENNDDLSPDTSRFSLRTHNDDGKILESLNILRVSGLVGITDIPIDPGDAPIIPTTLFNVQGDNSCNVRFSSSGLQSSSLDIIGNGNTRASGVQIAYDPVTDTAKFSLIRPSGGIGRLFNFMSVTNDGSIFIGQTPSGFSVNSGTIAIREQNSAPDYTDLYGKLYVKPKIGGGQTQAIYFLDDDGNEFDITDSVYGDERGNTYAGEMSPAVKPTWSAHNNTTLGHYTLTNLTTGDENTVIGGGSLFTATVPSGNTIVGAFNLASGANPSGNIVIGYANLQRSLSDPSGCIVIGTGIKDGATDTMDDYTLAIGHGDIPLVYGSLGGDQGRSFDIKNGGLSIGNENDRHVLSISHGFAGVREVTIIDLQDNVNTAAVSGSIALRFTDSDGDTRQLMEFDHVAVAMPGASNETSTTYNYVGPTGTDSKAIARPFVHLEGDMLLRGCMKFADGTYMDSADAVSNHPGTGLRTVQTSIGRVIHLDFVNMEDASGLAPLNVYSKPDIASNESYVALSVANGSDDFVGRISLTDLSEYVRAPGNAAVVNNCNHVFSNAEVYIDDVNNSGCVMIGCDVATAATGWKHAVMIGREAGANATTANVYLASDHPVIFIGHRAGKDADNVSNLVSIGNEAGYLAKDANGSVFIGQNAGTYNSMDDSIGIGGNALRGVSNTHEGGSQNIEIVAGLDDNQRLMYQKGHFSNRLNIQNTIAGNTDERKISIGDAVLSPDAPLSVRYDQTIAGHACLDNVQTWYCDNEKVAQVNCSGVFKSIDYPATIEGFATEAIAAPAGYGAPYPTSGILKTKGEDFLDGGDIYITNRDPTLSVEQDSYVVAHLVNNEYRPVWVTCAGA